MVFGGGPGPVGDPANLIYYLDVKELGGGLALVYARQIDELPEWGWQIVANGALLGRLTLSPGVEGRALVQLPSGSILRVGLLPDGYPVESLQAYWAESARCVLRWDPVACDSFEIYSDGGLGGAVDQLLASVDGADTRYITEELDPGTYVFNIIPIRNGQLAAPVDDASHQDIVHTVTEECLPPENLLFDEIGMTGADYDLTVEFDESPTAGVTYEYQATVNIPINGDSDTDWLPCTSPFVATVSGVAGDLALIRVRAVKGGARNGESRTLHLALPDPALLLIPDDTVPQIGQLVQDGEDAQVTCTLRTTSFEYDIVFDLQYTDDLEGEWEGFDEFAFVDEPYAATLGNVYRATENLPGLIAGVEYWLRIRARNSYAITDWSTPIPIILNEAPSVAAAAAIAVGA